MTDLQQIDMKLFEELAPQRNRLGLLQRDRVWFHIMVEHDPSWRIPEDKCIQVRMADTVANQGVKFSSPESANFPQAVHGMISRSFFCAEGIEFEPESFMMVRKDDGTTEKVFFLRILIEVGCETLMQTISFRVVYPTPR